MKLSLDIFLRTEMFEPNTSHSHTEEMCVHICVSIHMVHVKNIVGGAYLLIIAGHTKNKTVPECVCA